MLILELFGLVIGVGIVVRAIIWSAGWSPLPPGAQLGNVPGEIPCLHDLPKFSGRWIDGKPGKLPDRGWWVYQQFDRSDGLVYEGRTNDPRRRFAQHVESGKVAEEGWYRWELYKCPTEEYMMELEKLGILYHNPATNKERWELNKIIVDPSDYVEIESEGEDDSQELEMAWG